VASWHQNRQVMYTIRSAAAKLGLSEDQVRRRLRVVLRRLDGQAGAWVARGPHGQLLLAPEIVDLIGASESKARQDGVTFAAALAAFAQGGASVAKPEGKSHNGAKLAPRPENPDQALARAIILGAIIVAIGMILGLTILGILL